MNNGKSIRLQGHAFKKMRHQLKMVSWSESKEGRYRANMVHKETGQAYHHWMNNDEMMKFTAASHKWPKI